LNEPVSTYLYALAQISATFVGFSALITLLRESLGEGVSAFEAWVTRAFIELGFSVTAAALTPTVLMLCKLDDALIWHLCSAAYGIFILIFALSYPFRRRAVSGRKTPFYIHLDVALLLCVAAVLGWIAGHAVGPVTSGLYAASVTSVLFVGGIAYLHAFGMLIKRDRSAPR